jgi:hypothetical protein
MSARARRRLTERPSLSETRAASRPAFSCEASVGLVDLLDEIVSRRMSAKCGRKILTVPVQDAGRHTLGPARARAQGRHEKTLVYFREPGNLSGVVPPRSTSGLELGPNGRFMEGLAGRFLRKEWNGCRSHPVLLVCLSARTCRIIARGLCD